MLKVITGWIKIDNQDLIEEISGFVNGTCVVEEEEEDYILVSEMDPDTFNTLCEMGFITEDELNETFECDAIKFYVD